jgi:hypothetical protein
MQVGDDGLQRSCLGRTPGAPNCSRIGIEAVVTKVEVTGVARPLWCTSLLIPGRLDLSKVVTGTSSSCCHSLLSGELLL